MGCTGWIDSRFHVLPAVGVMALLEHADAQPSCAQGSRSSKYVLLYRLKTLLVIESMHVLPSCLCSDEVPMLWVGFKGRQSRHGVHPRGIATWQDERQTGTIGPDTQAQNIVTWHVRDPESVWNGAIRPWPRTVSLGKGDGQMDGADRRWLDQHGRCCEEYGVSDEIASRRCIHTAPSLGNMSVDIEGGYPRDA